MGEKGNLAGAGDLLGIGSGTEMDGTDKGADRGPAHGGGGAANSVADMLNREPSGGVDNPGASHDAGGVRGIGFGSGDGPEHEGGPGREAGPGR